MIKELRPNFPSEASSLADQRDEIRQQNAADPCIKELTIQINDMINEHRRNKWREHLEESDLGSRRLWAT